MTLRNTDLFKYIFHSGSDKVFVANVSEITTFNKDVQKDVRRICTNSWLDTPQFISSTVIPDLLPIF